jgi:hypothetical protein
VIGPDLLGDDFRAWFEARLVKLHTWASELVAKGRQVSPALIVFNLDDQMGLMPLPFDTVGDKNMAAALHRWTATLSIARDGVIMVGEAWLAPSLDADEAEHTRIHREGISNHPERTEAVVWNALRGERQLFAMAEIVRPHNRLGALQFIDPRRELMSGRMVPEQRSKPN